MIKLTEEQKNGIRKWLPDKAEEYIENGTLSDLVDDMCLLSAMLMTKEYDPTDESREVERLMDSIAWDNTH